MCYRGVTRGLPTKAEFQGMSARVNIHLFLQPFTRLHVTKESQLREMEQLGQEEQEVPGAGVCVPITESGDCVCKACVCVCATPICLQPALPSFSCLTSKEHTHVSWHTMVSLREPAAQHRTEAR